MNNRISIVLAAVAAILSVVLFADGPTAVAASPDAPVVTTLFSDGSTNTWTQADLVAALQLMNRRYHRDCETPSGRTAWHGRLVAQVVDTNELVKIERYADGTSFAFPFTVPAPVKPKTTVNTQGVPKRLAELRAKRAAEKNTVSNVTVTVTAGE